MMRAGPRLLERQVSLDLFLPGLAVEGLSALHQEADGVPDDLDFLLLRQLILPEEVVNIWRLNLRGLRLDNFFLGIRGF